MLLLYVLGRLYGSDSHVPLETLFVSLMVSAFFDLLV
jgi:hypothetical protein